MKKYRLFRYEDTPIGGEFAYCTEEDLAAATEEFQPFSTREISDEEYAEAKEIQHKRGHYLATGHWLA